MKYSQYMCWRFISYKYTHFLLTLTWQKNLKARLLLGLNVFEAFTSWGQRSERQYCWTNIIQSTLKYTVSKSDSCHRQRNLDQPLGLNTVLFWHWMTPHALQNYLNPCCFVFFFIFPFCATDLKSQTALCFPYPHFLKCNYLHELKCKARVWSRIYQSIYACVCVCGYISIYVYICVYICVHKGVPI